MIEDRDLRIRMRDGVHLAIDVYRPDGKGLFPVLYAPPCINKTCKALTWPTSCRPNPHGEPCQEIDPWRQVRDYRDAITCAETLPKTDPNRIGIWGTSYSVGHVLVVGAIDRRVTDFEVRGTCLSLASSLSR